LFINDGGKIEKYTQNAQLFEMLNVQLILSEVTAQTVTLPINVTVIPDNL